MTSALDQWLTLSGTKEEAFAASIGATQAAVNQWRKRRREPRLRHALRIVEATGGAVRLEDLVIDRD